MRVFMYNDVFCVIRDSMHDVVGYDAHYMVRDNVQYAMHDTVESAIDRVARPILKGEFDS